MINNSLEKNQNLEEAEKNIEPQIDNANLNDLSLQELIDYTTELTVEGKAISNSKEVENIKSVFYTKVRAEKNALLQEFINQGGKEEDFKFTHELENLFKEKYKIYKSLRNKERDILDKSKEENYKIKTGIINEIDELINKSETLKETFDQFKSLQEKWRNTGAAPINVNNELWQSYHHHVEKFYDYISINRELRDLDFKKNLQKKTEICEKAEGLLKEKSINKSHKELQSLHDLWKEIGPVQKEIREEIWQRFKEVSRKLNKKRNEHFVALKQKNAENAELKKQVCNQIEQLSENTENNHKSWATLTSEFEQLQKKWKEIGRLDKVDNKIAWQNFREVSSNFQRLKNNFYKSRKEDFKKAINEKTILCNEVEKLSLSEEWKSTTEKIIKIQNDWKKTGFVPKKQSDQLWNKFRTSCDTFFNRKNAFFKNLDKEKEENFNKKSELLKSIKTIVFKDNKKEDLAQIDQFIKSWNNIGYVSKKEIKIEDKFEKEINNAYKKLKIDSAQVEEIKFKNKLESLKSNKDTKKIENEKSFIRNKINDLQKELNQYETNISFFANSKGAEKLKKQVQDKIDLSIVQINKFKQKLKMLNSI